MLISSSKSLQMKNVYPFITSTNNLLETMLTLGVVVTKRCTLNQVCIESSLKQHSTLGNERVSLSRRDFEQTFYKN